MAPAVSPLLLLLSLPLTLILLSAPPPTAAAPAADQVIVLPGLKQQPSFKHYSGYLKAGGDRHLHYWLVESAHTAPAKAPLVLWFNGGPGCSSMEGMLRENGPFTVNDQAWLQMNPYAWNRDANVLYIESPAGVGFSYSDSNKTKTNDTQVAEDNYLALKSFFVKFPEYAGREVHISGESYGGVYVPTLAVRVLSDSSINLRGLLIGNGIDSWPLNSLSLLYFGYYHGLLGDRLWANLTAACCDACVGVRCDFYAGKAKRPACAALLTKAEAMTDGLNIYNVYQPCYGGVPDSAKEEQQQQQLESLFYQDPIMDDDLVGSASRLWSKLTMAQSAAAAQSQLPSPQQLARKYLLRRGDRLTGTAGVDPPCTNSTAITTYLNQPTVRYALHVKDTGPFSVCSDLDYTVEYNDMTPVYQKLLQTAGRLRITLYNGDVDMACNFLQTEWFLQNLNQTVAVARKPWYFQDPVNGRQVGGFVKQWAGNLTYLTVRGSGHMVPEDKPVQAFELFKNHMAGTVY